MTFKSLPLGARFKYLNGVNIWIKISGEGVGLIAEYDPEFIKHENWVGQRICSFADTIQDTENIEVILMEN